MGTTVTCVFSAMSSLNHTSNDGVTGHPSENMMRAEVKWCGVVRFAIGRFDFFTFVVGTLTWVAVLVAEEGGGRLARGGDAARI